MPRDYNKISVYYEVLVHFRSRKEKKYSLTTKDALDRFLGNAKDNDTIISYVVYRVEKSIYLQQVK